MNKLIILGFAFLMITPVIFAQSKAGKTDTTRHPSFYSCSMHPDVKSNTPGKCPKCGMDLTLTGKEKMKKEVTKTYSCPVHVNVSSHDPGKCPQCGRKLTLSPKEQMKAEIGKVYTCPMHPEVALDKNGFCPKCGKTLVLKKNNHP